MPILVDSNILLDIAQNDPVWGPWSDAAFVQCRTEGLIVNPMIYAELCSGAATAAVVDVLLQT